MIAVHSFGLPSTEQNVEEFIYRLYSLNERDKKINDVRFKLFTKGTKELKKLPPTQFSLQQHIKRAHNQSIVWFSATVPQTEICSPIGNGWYCDSFGNGLLQLSSDEAFPDPSMYLELTHLRASVVTQPDENVVYEN